MSPRRRFTDSGGVRWRKLPPARVLSRTAPLPTMGGVCLHDVTGPAPTLLYGYGGFDRPRRRLAPIRVAGSAVCASVPITVRGTGRRPARLPRRLMESPARTIGLHHLFASIQSGRNIYGPRC
jgi:hypothetical protein